jgi:hypothetical protein
MGQPSKPVAPRPANPIGYRIVRMMFDDFRDAEYVLSDFSGLLSLFDVGVVYVFFYVPSEGEIPIPFYVGETNMLPARIGDHFRAGFKDSTSFRVGEAARYLKERNNGCRVRVKYRRSSDSEALRKKDEGEIKARLRSHKAPILNSLRGWSYLCGKTEEECRTAVRAFCDQLISRAIIRAN